MENELLRPYFNFHNSAHENHSERWETIGGGHW